MRSNDDVRSILRTKSFVILGILSSLCLVLQGCSRSIPQSVPPKSTFDAVLLAGFQQAVGAQLFGATPVRVRRSKSTRGDEIFTFEPVILQKARTPGSELWQFQADFKEGLQGSLSVKFKGFKSFPRTKDGKETSTAAMNAIQTLSKQNCLTMPLVLQVHSVPAGYEVLIDLASGRSRLVEVTKDLRVTQVRLVK